MGMFNMAGLKPAKAVKQNVLSGQTGSLSEIEVPAFAGSTGHSNSDRLLAV